MLKLINSYNLNRKILFFWFFIGAIIFFGSFFVIYNSVLAADDNANQVGCRSDIDYCDADYGSCVDVYHYQWTLNGYPSGAGNKNCCGDDRQEFILSCYNVSPGASCSGTQACCPTENYCVYNGQCYATSSFFNTSDSSSDLEYCSRYSDKEDKDMLVRWFDQDNNRSSDNGCPWTNWFSSASYCGNAGPNGVCDDDDGGAFCCGDDVNETTNDTTSVEFIRGNYGQTGITIGIACCKSYASCVKDGRCYNFGSEVYLDGNTGANDQYARCEDTENSEISGAWWDCDKVGYSSSISDFCSNSICGSSSGIYAGESGVGEYPNTSILGCCGDDIGENYAELCPGVSGSRKCCNSSGDKINGSGNCVSTCNNPPNTPSNPTPSSGATCQNTNLTLSWAGGDPDAGDSVTYFVYWCAGSSCSPSLQGNIILPGSTTNISYSFSGSYNTTYYWQVVAQDSQDNTAFSSIGQFATKTCNPSDACCQSDGCSWKPSGTTCGSTIYGSWGSCNVTSGQCTGTQLRTATAYTCNTSHSCVTGTSSSETQNCNAGNDTACETAFNYCKTASTCDTWSHQKSCQSGSCTTSYINETNVPGTACAGQSCGSYSDYCLATAGTCSSSSETCNPPSYTDSCVIDQVSGGSFDSRKQAWLDNDGYYTRYTTHPHYGRIYVLSWVENGTHQICRSSSELKGVFNESDNYCVIGGEGECSEIYIDSGNWVEKVVNQNNPSEVTYNDLKCVSGNIPSLTLWFYDPGSGAVDTLIRLGLQYGNSQANSLFRSEIRGPYLFSRLGYDTQPQQTVARFLYSLEDKNISVKWSECNYYQDKNNPNADDDGWVQNSGGNPGKVPADKRMTCADDSQSKWQYAFSYNGNNYIPGYTYDSFNLSRDMLYYGMDQWVKTGVYEFDSMSYTQLGLYSMRLLYDFAARTNDPDGLEMQKRAKMTLDLMMLDDFDDFSANQRGGHLGRTYRSSTITASDASCFYEYLGAWGEQKRMECASAFVSNYRPSAPIWDFGDLSDESNEYWHFVKENNRANFLNPKLGKSNYVTKQFNLGGSQGRWQLNILGYPFKIWINSVPGDADKAACSPGECYNSLGTDGYQYRNSMLIKADNPILHISKKGNFDSGEENLSTYGSYQRDYKIGSGWKYFREGNMALAMQMTNDEAALEVGIIDSSCSAYHCYPSFNDFVNANRQLGSNSFRNGKGDTLTANLTDYSTPFDYNYPYKRLEIYSSYGKTVGWSNNVMTINYHGKQCTYDFNTWTYSGDCGGGGGTITPLADNPPIKSACSDGLDNDGDAKIDYPADPGCTSTVDDNETDPSPPVCNDNGICDSGEDTQHCPDDCPAPAPPADGRLTADFNCDNYVNIYDFGNLMSCWGSAYDPNHPYNCAGGALSALCGSPDLTGDNKVDVNDLGVLLSGWQAESDNIEQLN